MSGGSLHENYRHAGAPLPPDRSTGLVIAVGLLLVAYALRHHYYLSEAAIDLALVIAIVSLSYPRFLRPLNVVWMQFAGLLSKIINPIVMTLLYGVVIVPAGLLRQRVADPLRLKRETGRATYWIDRDASLNTPMFRQF